MTEANSSASYAQEGRTVQGVVLSDSEKQAVNEILRRGLASLRGGDQPAAMVSGILYVDPPGICIPIGV
jgi:hypothetical protein